MRILHILDHSLPVQSGYAFRTQAILRHQRDLGWETEHITGPKHWLHTEMEEEVDGLRFYRTSPLIGIAQHVGLLSPLAVIRALTRRLIEIIPSIKPDILHAHSPPLNGVAALWAGRRYRIPVVYEIRAFWEDAAVDHGTTREWGLRYRMTRSLETLVIQHATAVTTISEGLQQDILARRIEPEKVTVIPNAVNTKEFSTRNNPDTSLREHLKLDENRVLGFIGSFYAYEGLSLLLKALPDICLADPSVRVLLVGHGPEQPSLKKLCVSLGLADKAIFVGQVPHNEVTRYYSLIDILVYPRLSMRLTELVTPLKPLEAMALGHLVVASDVGGHRELIRDGETGYLFVAGDESALVSTIVRVLENPQSWTGMRRAARCFVETERSWSASVGRYRSVYAACQRSQ